MKEIKVSKILIGDTINVDGENYIATLGYHAANIEGCMRLLTKDNPPYYVINPDPKANIKVYGLTNPNKTNTIA